MNIRLSTGKVLPIEMHKIKIVQEVNLPNASERLRAIRDAGFNTFLLRTRDVFLDMLTDSGTNAMSDRQQAAMMVADDAYAGSESFYRLEDAVRDVLGFQWVMPVHQGRAAEHLLAKAFVKPGDVVLMNYHFTTSKAHIDLAGGKVLELFGPDALETESSNPFKGNLDLGRLAKAIAEFGPERISYLRMEATTNLIGGQPFSLQNLREVHAVAVQHNIPLVFDGSLISENAYAVESALLQGYARDHDMAVLAANYSGTSGGHVSAGRSAFWAPGGRCVVAAPDDAPCIVWAARSDSGWAGGVLSVSVPA